ncbi:MAG: hypothetical protein JXN64_05400 [Spirochaetes bacterium]|nr:hypothetical protein [Spirochaetota bacterium]
MFELYLEGRMANDETVEEIIKKLEERKNYIPSSDHARREYSYAILKEYKNYLKEKAGKST